MAHATEIAIEGELSIYRATELRQWLADSLPPGGDVALNLAGVSDIDTAGAQLLLAAQRLARDRDCRLRCVDHSASVLNLLALFDLTAQLCDPIAAAGTVP